VAVAALGLPVIAPERPAGEPVIEALHASWPAHERVASTAVLHVTAAAPAAAILPPVEAGACGDRARDVGVAAPARGGAHLRALRVALRAARVSVEARVIARELARREELRLDRRRYPDCENTHQ
jgi:hypothetical protein